MKSRIILIITIATILLVKACAVNDISKRNMKYSVQIGAGKGGIVENTDLTVVPNSVGTIDAFTGATKTGFNGGFHINKPLKYGELETGLDFMTSNHVFKYNDINNLYDGERNIDLYQLMIPLTYNFNLFAETFPNSDIQFKIGYLGQINFLSSSDKGNLPSQKYNKLSHGVVAGISAYPITLSNESKIGFFLDAYRGSQIYEDFYNRTSYEMPASAFAKFGIRYKF